MKLPDEVLVAQEKLTNYLLTKRKWNDKSQRLGKAGFIVENWRVLRDNLIKQAQTAEANPLEKTGYGQNYEIRGKLTGPNGRELRVRTIWMTEHATGKTKFITMYPDKSEVRK